MAAVNESPVACDSALSAMMDEFEEGTLLSLLEDRELFSYLQTLPVTPTGGYQDTDDDLDLSELFGDDVLLPDCFPARRRSRAPLEAVPQKASEAAAESLTINSRSGSMSDAGVKELPSPIHSCGSESDISNLDSNDSDSAEDALSITSRPAKRRRVDGVERVHDRRFLTSCVEHDHCYTRASSSERLRSPGGSPSEKDTPNEEDTGYETMSSSTSPGSGAAVPSSSPTVPQASPLLPPPSLPPLHSINPVALIDARIKHFMRSQQVCLTEEEKETLKAEGLPIPTTLPLTKVEEKALKSVRRKIRNKVAAQESRKRKKEHMEELEDKVRLCTSENLRLQKKVENLESENRSLLTQLKKFKALVAGSGNSRHTTKVGACLMVVVLCFAVLLGGWVPQHHSYWTSVSTDYATTSVRSRSLLSVEAVSYPTFPRAMCDWFRYIFLPDRATDHPKTESSTQHRPHSPSAWPDIFLSSYTPLTGQHHNSTPAIAA